MLLYSSFICKAAAATSNKQLALSFATATTVPNNTSRHIVTQAIITSSYSHTELHGKLTIAFVRLDKSKISTYLYTCQRVPQMRHYCTKSTRQSLLLASSWRLFYRFSSDVHTFLFTIDWNGPDCLFELCQALGINWVGSCWPAASYLFIRWWWWGVW